MSAQPARATPAPGASMFVEVAVALPVAGTFHYRAPREAAVGSRVLVPFGARAVSGVIVKIGEPPAQVERVLDVRELLDPAPALSAELVALCLWIAEYYEAPPGEVLRAALPAGTQVIAAPVAMLTEAGRVAAQSALPRRERELLARLPAPKSKLDRALVDQLVARGWIEIGEKRRERVKAKKVRFAKAIGDADLGRAAKQRELLDQIAKAGEVDASTLPAAHLRALVARGLVAIEEREVTSVAAAGLGLAAGAAKVPPPLTDEQRAALEVIEGALGQGFASFLLHGVTGSGKTEVYLHAIAKALDSGGTALVLVPEISLTPQLAARFRARFGDQVAVLHSGLSERDRLGEWQRLRRGEARIALGARSAVFAPLERLAIIVVDEEHDPSFKQDEGVRYHGRDVALVRAQRAGAVCVLGSATPSIESYAGKHRLLRMPSRVTARPMPAVEIVDLKTWRPDGDAMLSAKLATAITETLAEGDQVILFINRRGYATFVLCRACGEAFRCPHCSVSLTYHLRADRLECHYCGYTRRVPETCPKCGQKGAIDKKGLGTEKVAEGIARRFPTARVARLDRDVTTGAKIEGVLSKVARREVDILVGTQMVTKGHDFPGVTLVGVLCADVGLSMPDFRASERTFQLLTQVAGRAGRGEKPGRALIQTYRPDAAAVTCAAAHDYEAFFAAEMAARADTPDVGYPPHARLAAVRVDGPDARTVAAEAHRLATSVGEVPSVVVRGPVEAPLARLRGRTRWQLWLRSTDRAALRRVLRGLAAVEVASGIRVAIDVDPVSSM